LHVSKFVFSCDVKRLEPLLKWVVKEFFYTSTWCTWSLPPY